MKTRSVEPVSVRAEHSFLYEKVIHYTFLAWHVSYEMKAGFIWHNTKKEVGVLIGVPPFFMLAFCAASETISAAHVLI